MDVIPAWTGRSVKLLRVARRQTIEEFAGKLGIGARTVAKWEADPAFVPSLSMQQVLDTALERLPEAVRTRFCLLTQDARQAPGVTQQEAPGLLAGASPAVKVRPGQLTAGQPAGSTGNARALQIAIAIVLREDQVLLVLRRDESAGIAWQFPAGIIKPGEHAEDVAVRETLAETGIHCSVAGHIGGRLHPVTGVLCDYFRCPYLAGDAANLDNVENAAVIWAPRHDVARFITRGHIYPPVLMILEDQRDPAVT